MTIDQALQSVLNTMNTILIPGSEAAKMEAAKGDIQAVITSVQRARTQEAQKQEDEKHED